MNWKEENNHLIKTFELNSFKACVEFLNKVTPVAEELLHHPDVTIENYRCITFRLKTHDEDSITKKDYKLAKMIDDLM